MKLPLLSLASLAFAALARAQSPPVGMAVNIQDYKGNVMDLSDGDPTNLTPVQTLNHKVDELTQAWIIQPATSGLFTIQNLASGTFLSYTLAAAGTASKCSQICGSSTIKSTWKFTANNKGFNIIDSSGNAITSWPLTNSSIIGPGPTTPLTLQTLDSSAVFQNFTIVAFS